MKKARKNLSKKKVDELKATKKKENVKARKKKKEYYSKFDEKISALDGEVATLKQEVHNLQSQLKIKVDALNSTESELRTLRVDNKNLERVNGELVISTTSTMKCLVEYRKLVDECVNNKTISAEKKPELETFTLSRFARNLCKIAQMYKVVVRVAPQNSKGSKGFN